MTEPSELSSVFTHRTGVVETFDDHVGAGTVTGDDGSRWDFHCTAIGDGTRTIASGTAVAFLVAPGPNGFEATEVLPR